MDAAFQLQFDKLANTVLAVSKTDIDALPEIKGWRIRHFAKIAKMFDSFCVMFDGTKDYVTLCALIRMIYDNWYSFLWIYECSEGEDVQLRYYLYVLDSIKQRKTTMLKMINGVESLDSGKITLGTKVHISSKIIDWQFVKISGFK